MSSQSSKRYGSAFGRPSGSGTNAGFGSEPSNPLRGESFAEPDVFSGSPSSGSELPVDKLQNEAEVSTQASSFSESLSFERNQEPAQTYAAEEYQPAEAPLDYNSQDYASYEPQAEYPAAEQSYETAAYADHGYSQQTYDDQAYASSADNLLIEGYESPAQDDYYAVPQSSFGSSFGSEASASSFGGSSASGSSGWRSRFRSTSTASSFGSPSGSDYGAAQAAAPQTDYQTAESYGASPSYGVSPESEPSYGSGYDGVPQGNAYEAETQLAAEPYEQASEEEAYQAPTEGFFSSFLSRFGAWLWPLLILLIIAAIIFMGFMWLTGSSSGIDLDAPQTIESVKRMLEIITIPAGDINGEIDEDFRNGVRTFQEWYGFEQTGELSEELIQEMQEMISAGQ